MRKLVIVVAIGLTVATGCSTTEEGQPSTTTAPRQDTRLVRACRSEKDTLATALEAYRAQQGHYPESVDDLTGPDGVLDSSPRYWEPGPLDASGNLTVVPIDEAKLPDGCT